MTGDLYSPFYGIDTQNNFLSQTYKKDKVTGNFKQLSTLFPNTPPYFGHTYSFLVTDRHLLNLVDTKSS